MSNPLLKKNPVMSMWLTAANRAAAPFRAQATAQVKRHVSAAVAQARNETIKQWTSALAPAKVKPTRKR